MSCGLIYHFSQGDGLRDCQICGSYGPGIWCIVIGGMGMITRTIAYKGHRLDDRVEFLCRSCIGEAIRLYAQLNHTWLTYFNPVDIGLWWEEPFKSIAKAVLEEMYA